MQLYIAFNSQCENLNKEWNQLFKTESDAILKKEWAYE